MLQKVPKCANYAVVVLVCKIMPKIMLAQSAKA